MNVFDKDLVLSYLSLASIDDLVRFYDVYHHDYLYRKFSIKTPTFHKDSYDDVMPSTPEFIGVLFYGTYQLIKTKLKPHYMKYRDSNIYRMLYNIQHYNADAKNLIIQWNDKMSYSVYDFFSYFFECELNRALCTVKISTGNLDDAYYIIDSKGKISAEIYSNLKNSELLSYLSKHNFNIFVDNLMLQIIHNELKYLPALRIRGGTFVDDNGLGFYPYKFLYRNPVEFQ